SQTFNSTSSASDELIPGFGFGTSHSKTTASNFVDTDPFVVLESSMPAHILLPTNLTTLPWVVPCAVVPRPLTLLVNIEKLKRRNSLVLIDLDSFFSSGPRSSSVPKSRTATEALRKPAVNVPKRTTNGVSSAKKPPAPAANLVDDFLRFLEVLSCENMSFPAIGCFLRNVSLFTEDPPIFKEFEEIQGRDRRRREERPDGIVNREQRAVWYAQAVADMNNRDHQSRIEQQQRTRISETADAEIKRWATGKEGNMRALLSSLQIIFTSSAVKKVYRKATLYVHPDNVQQKGATLEQKYIAEKVFDI
ncbi:hypothetical protein HID58_024516, partial [Brassica napus]